MKALSVPIPYLDSIDLRISAGGDVRLALDLQLKATTKLLDNKENCFRFRLRTIFYSDTNPSPAGRIGSP